MIEASTLLGGGPGLERSVRPVPVDETSVMVPWPFIPSPQGSGVLVYVWFPAQRHPPFPDRVHG